MNRTRKSYPSDVSDAEWEFLVFYLTLMREDAPQREHSLRDLFNGVRYVVKTGCQWRFLPHDLPPWTAVYQQARRWLHAGVFEQIAPRPADDRAAGGRTGSATLGRDPRRPHAAIDAGERGPRRLRRGQEEERLEGACGCGYAGKSTGGDCDACQRAGASPGGGVGPQVQAVTGGTVEVAFVDQGYTGADAAAQAQAEGIRLEVVKHTEAKKGFVLLPRRWVVERSFGWLGRFRRLARDYERLAESLAGWHWLAFLTLLLARTGFNSA